MRTYHQDGTAPEGAETVFVFGSNLAGIHGAGAARAALNRFGAEMGCGVGRMGQGFAIPTKDLNIATLPLADIERYVEEFINYARDNPGKRFFVTRIGCGLAGYRDADIAPLFVGAPENCSFAEQWREFLDSPALSQGGDAS